MTYFIPAEILKTSGYVGGAIKKTLGVNKDINKNVPLGL